MYKLENYEPIYKYEYFSGKYMTELKKIQVKTMTELEKRQAKYMTEVYKTIYISNRKKGQGFV